VEYAPIVAFHRCGPALAARLAAATRPTRSLRYVCFTFAATAVAIGTATYFFTRRRDEGHVVHLGATTLPWYRRWERIGTLRIADENFGGTQLTYDSTPRMDWRRIGRGVMSLFTLRFVTNPVAHMLFPSWMPYNLEYAPPPLDLTRFGIEPNPGPLPPVNFAMFNELMLLSRMQYVRVMARHALPTLAVGAAIGYGYAWVADNRATPGDPLHSHDATTRTKAHVAHALPTLVATSSALVAFNYFAHLPFRIVPGRVNPRAWAMRFDSKYIEWAADTTERAIRPELLRLGLTPEERAQVTYEYRARGYLALHGARSRWITHHALWAGAGIGAFYYSLTHTKPPPKHKRAKAARDLLTSQGVEPNPGPLRHPVATFLATAVATTLASVLPVPFMWSRAQYVAGRGGYKRDPFAVIVRRTNSALGTTTCPTAALVGYLFHHWLFAGERVQDPEAPPGHARVFIVEDPVPRWITIAEWYKLRPTPDSIVATNNFVLVDDRGLPHRLRLEQTGADHDFVEHLTPTQQLDWHQLRANTHARDELVRYGVEPNPGPGFQDAVRTLLRGISRRVSRAQHIARRVELIAYAGSEMIVPGRHELYKRVEIVNGVPVVRAAARYKPPDLLDHTIFPHRRIREDRKVKHQYVLGIGMKHYRPVTAAKTLDNEMESLKRRVLCQTSEQDPVYVAQAIRWWKANRKYLLPGLRRDIQSVPFDEYIRRVGSTPAVKEKLLAAKAELDELGITEDSVLPHNLVRAYSKRSMFLKLENLNYRTPYGRKNKAARCIMVPTPHFQCLVGPWVMAFQDAVKRCWTIRNHVTFTSGLSASELARKVIDTHALGFKCGGDDAALWDVSLKGPLLKYEVSLQKTCGAPIAVVQLLQASTSLRGRSTYGIVFSNPDGQRNSGDPGTSVCNSLLNGLMHCYAFHRATGVAARNIHKHLVMLVQGDDNYILHRAKYHVDWPREMAKFGIKSEMEYYDSPYDVPFCSSRILDSQSGPRFTPNVGRLISRIAYFVQPPLNVSPESLVRGTALGLYNAVAHHPPARAYLQRLLQLTEGHEPYYSPVGDWKMRYPSAAESSPDTWADLDKWYGWNHSRQAAWEKELSTMKLHREYVSTAGYHLCEVDTSGPKISAMGVAARTA